MHFKLNALYYITMSSLALTACGSSISSTVSGGASDVSRELASAKAAADPSGNPSTVTISGVTYTYCAAENGECTFSGSSLVVFGAFPPNAPSAMYSVNGPFSKAVGCYVGQVANSDPAYGYGKMLLLYNAGTTSHSDTDPHAYSHPDKNSYTDSYADKTPPQRPRQLPLRQAAIPS